MHIYIIHIINQEFIFLIYFLIAGYLQQTASEQFVELCFEAGK